MPLSNCIFYVYAYHFTGEAVPYYVGKGCKRRARSNIHRVEVPKDPANIRIVARNLSETEAFILEKILIKYFGREDQGSGGLLNRSNGGEGPSGYVRSEETKRKMSIAKTGTVFSEKHRENISKSLKGRKMSKDVIEKRSRTRRGKLYSEESKTRMSEAQKARWETYICSDETRKKLAISTKGKPWSEARRKAQEERNRGKF